MYFPFATFTALWLACLCAALATTAQAAKPEPACPQNRSGHGLLAAAERVKFVVPVMFLKVDKTGAGPVIWKFKAGDTIKPLSVNLQGPVSFFTKPAEADDTPLKLNDRFLLLSNAQELDLPGTLKTMFVRQDKAPPEHCIIKSNIYLDDFIKRGLKVETSRDNSCRIQVRNLEANPLINDALSFRCVSTDLEKRRIAQLAAAYAKAKRFGNAVVTMELINGNFNASTLSTVLDWADEWIEKDERSTRRIVERTLTAELHKHFVESRQMPAMKDILEDRKRFKNLRDTDWFPALVKDWANGGTAR